MATLLIDTKAEAVPEILSILETVVPLGQISLLEKKALPQPAHTAKKEFEDQAKLVARVIRPKLNQRMRTEAIRFALGGKDTFKLGNLDQLEDADASLRNALGALSKSLRKIFLWEASPIDRIATREKYFAKDGRYLGTRYFPTKLGIRVRELLEAEDAF